MSDSPKNMSAVQKYVSTNYGELSFFPSLAMLSTQSASEIEVAGKERKYFAPEAIFELDGPKKKMGFIFGAGGYGRALAVADSVLLVFTISDDDGEVVVEAKTKLPDMSAQAKVRAKEDINFQGTMFSITGTIPDLPFEQNGFLSMTIEFHFTDPELLDLLEGDGEEESVAIFAHEMCRVRVHVNRPEE